MRIVGNVVIVVGVVSVSEADSPIRRKVRNVVHAGRTIVAAISAIAAVAERQIGDNILTCKGELPQMLQMQVREKLQMLKMLQLQLRDSCNCNGMRNSRVIDCEGAAGAVSDGKYGSLYPYDSTKWSGKGDILSTFAP
ncbi:MAG: hypothetical protein JNM70_08695 [Anaerolineae bacterium]|nr:hypothetical protein [Anaerolineae bacterium]